MSAMLFNCDRCDGSVEMVQGGHRTREYRPGIELPVPENFPIPTCRRCGETYLTEAEAEALETALKPEYARYCKLLIDTACERAGVTVRELERVAGVTPTYFSHITRGRKQASLSLVRLLEALSLYPTEVERHVHGTTWRAASSHLRGMLKRPVRFEFEEIHFGQSRNDNAVAFTFDDTEPVVGLAKVGRPRVEPVWRDVSCAGSLPSTVPPKAHAA